MKNQWVKFALQFLLQEVVSMLGIYESTAHPGVAPKITALTTAINDVLTSL